MRVPLSWLRDFAPIDGDAAEVAAVLDDLGLVVEEIELVGEGLADVVVARVEEVSAIAGADRIRRVVVGAGAGPVEVVCGASNFAVGDLVALAPVGAVLPGGVAIGRRTMKGVTSNGMLCSGRELQLSEDQDGLMILNEVEGVAVGQHLTDALGIVADVVFDVAVEANRPDAWSMAGVARDLSARLGLPFVIPPTAALGPPGGGADGVGRSLGDLESGQPFDALASVRVDDAELCPRFASRVITGVQVAPSPRWLARRLVLAGMRPINNVVDASNYVMLELGQPTHPYDLDRLPGHGLVVRRATPGETLVTLDGVERELGRPGAGLGDTGQDCLICDGQGTPVGIGGIMGGASSEIVDGTSRVLLEAAYFVPMAIARTSKRLGLRTEASARFERGCDPAGIDRAMQRFCELLARTAGPAMTLAIGGSDAVGDVPRPVTLTVQPARVNALLGTSFPPDQMATLLAPLGIEATAPDGTAVTADEEAMAELSVTVPTFRPDIRPAPMGGADIAEEVARIYGYARIERRRPAWPQPGRLSDYQRDRRLLRDVLCGLGCSEAWTETFVTGSDQAQSGFAGSSIEVTNPLVESERYLRSSMMPGLVRAVIYNTERRQGDIRLFEIGTVFAMGGAPAPGGSGRPTADERVSAIFAVEGDDAWTAVAAWRTVVTALGIDSWTMDEHRPEGAGTVAHRYRSSTVTATTTAGDGPVAVGVVGELDPYRCRHLGLLAADGRPRRVGWLDLDMGTLLDRDRVARRSEASRPISRYPSSDIDLAFVVGEEVPAGSVEGTLRQAGGDLLESLFLFDVYRGPPLGEGARSLAYRLRFCSLERTLTDDEVGACRSACIGAVTEAHGARLR